MNKNFGLIGVAGFIAPKHLKAIASTKNNLLVSLDPHDSVGLIDRFFPESLFFKKEKYFIECPQFKKLDFISICSPNFLHKSHIELSLENNIDCICEKPLVLNTQDTNELLNLEEKYGKKIYPILQLRLDPGVINLKKDVENNPNKFFNIDLNYITTRGDWYFKSWKGNKTLSGGLLINIGIHFFDILCWIFGEPYHNELLSENKKMCKGHLKFKKAKVDWLLSVDPQHLPTNTNNVHKEMIINNKEKLSFNGENLHTLMYLKILQGEGFTLRDAVPSIKLIESMKKKIECL